MFNKRNFWVMKLKLRFRHPITLLEQAVDKHDSFKSYEKGWEDGQE